MAAIRASLLTLALVAGFLPVAEAAETSAEDAIVLVGAKIYPSPHEAPILRGTVVVEGGRIVAVGNSSDVPVPQGAMVIDSAGATIVAGFWNSHVHLLENKWDDASDIPVETVVRQLQEMLTRYGFVHVFETGTFNLSQTLELRRRIESGEVLGPAIYTTGLPIGPPAGSPIYIAPAKIAEPADVNEARDLVERQLSAGSDGVKIFAASPVSRTEVKVMPAEIAKAIVSAAHQRNKLVFAHPTNPRGVRLAVDSGVDILAHPSPDSLEPWDAAMVRQLVNSGISLIPTLKLFRWDPERQGVPTSIVKRILQVASQQLHDFSVAGGMVLFGTDVGYITDYDPTEEYVLMGQAGLDYKQILAALTTNPTTRFGVADRTGRIAPGMDADIVILEGDPADSIEAFSAVRQVFRKGVVIYSH
jgi:imidazolonepropionase-like amidohydrolase